MTIEQTILGSLITNEEFTRKVLPYIKAEYFQNPAEATVFEYIRTHVDKYNALPSVSVLMVSLENDSKVHNTKEIEKVLAEVDGEVHNVKWLSDVTEEFCKQQAI